MSQQAENKSGDLAVTQRSVYWDQDKSQLMLLDQRGLPHDYSYVAHTTVAQVIDSIKIMLVRGAPAIGAAGAFGMAIAGFSSAATTAEELLKDLEKAKKDLDDSRPTAVNLSWATARIFELAQLMAKEQVPFTLFRERLLREAQELAEDDVRINKSIGDNGASVIPHGANIVHHCNTGRLATVDYGTALGVIFSAHTQGKNIHVWVDETRPRLQGAKLTAWELKREGIPFHLIPDSASGLLMYNGKVDAVVFGADRVAANGDTANKIGTYKLAVCAHENGIPVYACVPTPTIDLMIASGRDIVIEERHSEEVTHIGDHNVAPVDCPVYNPAFDVTPHKYITAIVTEEGLCYPPFHLSLAAAKQKAEQRVRDAWKQRLEQYLKK